MIPWILNSLYERDNATKKPQNEIENIEYKKQSLITPLKNKIAALTQKNDADLQRAGQPVSGVPLPPMPTDGHTAFCVNCGTPYVQSEDVFCTGCGEKAGG
jgi:GH24 family phage-related lysozyme (muramidase)